jgi:hypothetical protein
MTMCLTSPAVVVARAINSLLPRRAPASSSNADVGLHRAVIEFYPVPCEPVVADDAADADPQFASEIELLERRGGEFGVLEFRVLEVPDANSLCGRCSATTMSRDILSQR